MNEELLKKLTEASGVSGYESKIAEIVIDESKLLCDEVKQDRLGSVLAIKEKENNKVKIMIASHMDEIGFIIKYIDSKGYVYVQPIGSWWAHLVLGQVFLIITDTGKIIEGVVGSKATHGLDQEIKSRVVEMNEVYIDLGVSGKEEVKALGVEIGNQVVPKSEFRVMNNPEYYCGKAFDDRIGVYIGIELLKRLKGKQHHSLTIAFTVQEEPGLRGARTVTEIVCPDIGIAIDTTVAGDTPANKYGCELGKGVAISMIDSVSLAHRGLVKEIEECCISHKIPHQYAVFQGGGTDSGNIHKQANGVVNLTLAIPIRYMHTHQSIIHKKDVEACVDLLEKFIIEMTEIKMKNIMD